MDTHAHATCRNTHTTETISSVNAITTAAAITTPGRINSIAIKTNLVQNYY